MKSKKSFAMDPSITGQTYDTGVDEHGVYILCRHCKSKSYNEHDILERYCGKCQAFHTSVDYAAAFASARNSQQMELYSWATEQRDAWKKLFFDQQKMTKRWRLVAVLACICNLYWTVDYCVRMYFKYFNH